MYYSVIIIFTVARHVYGYKKVFDGDSDPDKADYYTV